MLEDFLYGSIPKTTNASNIQNLLQELGGSMASTVHDSTAIYDKTDGEASLRIWHRFRTGQGMQTWQPASDAGRAWLAFRQTHKLSLGVAARPNFAAEVAAAFVKFPQPKRVISLVHSWAKVRDPTRSWEEHWASRGDNQKWQMALKQMNAIAGMLPSPAFPFGEPDGAPDPDDDSSSDGWIVDNDRDGSDSEVSSLFSD